MLVSFAAATGFGIWAYNLNTQLTQTRADYQALKGNNDKVTAEYSQAKTEFEAQSSKAQADLKDAQDSLKEAQAQIETLKGDLEKAKEENAALKKQIVAIQDKVDILSAFWFTDQANFQHKIDASKDTKLNNLYVALKDAKTNQASSNAFVELMSYMINAVINATGEARSAFVIGG
jgi:predicted nuclease with TOPRIM domain